MTFEVDVTGVLNQAARLRGVDARAIQKLETRTRATLIRRLPVAARRDIQQQYTLKAGAINERLSARQQGQNVVLIGRSKGIGLHLFRFQRPRSKKRSRVGPPDGISSQVQQSSAPVKIRATWAGKSGRIFRREKSGSGFVGRDPFKPLFGPSIAFMLRNQDRRDRLGDIAQGVLAAETDRLVASLK